MLDARPRSFYSVTGAGNNHFTSAREACDDRANGIVASVTGALGFRDCQLHEPLFRFVGSRDHVDPKLTRTLVANCYASPPKLPYARKYHRASRSRKPCATRARFRPHRHPRRSMIGAYGDTACSPRYEAQARKPQLGVSHSVRSRSPYGIRTAGQATAAHGADVYLLA